MATTLNIDDLAAEGSTYLISLTKLTKQPIVDIQGYLSDDYGDASFKLCHVVFADGTKIDVDGEHDFPYLSSYEADALNLDIDTLNALFEQGEWP